MQTRKIRLQTLALLLATYFASAGHAATYTVTRGDDPAPNGCPVGDCSLREALEAAVVTPAGDVVVLGPGLYNVTRGQLNVVGQVTIAGAGSALTRIVSTGAFRLMGVSTLGELNLAGVEMSSQQEALVATDSSALLQDVRVVSGAVAVQALGSTPASLRAYNSRLEGLICGGVPATCQVFDSEMVGVLIYYSNLTLAGVEVAATANASSFYIAGDGAVSISDSTIRGQPELAFVGSGEAAPDVQITRTRFIGNSGPLTSTRMSTIRMTDVEFRDNIVNSGNNTKPAAILASDEGAWRISRALFVGNRGGSGQGAAVRVTDGANVVMDNVTFYDNTFKTGNSGNGHTIGVDVTGNTSTLFWLFHATLRRAPSVSANVFGSVLRVNGTASNLSVRLFNSLVDGTCAFGPGAALLQAEGNIESIGNSCGLVAANNNRSNIPANQLLIGSLADHGGFTNTYLPASGSPLLDTATPLWCQFNPLEQRRYLRPAGGINCDVGAVEAGAIADSLFANGFE
ncbi:MAG: choice-of-anchor Q domain-containing protein [Dokdonella sp.]